MVDLWKGSTSPQFLQWDEPDRLQNDQVSVHARLAESAKHSGSRVTPEKRGATAKIGLATGADCHAPLVVQRAIGP